MRLCFASVQRPTTVSPARWMTASKPETDFGGKGWAGSHATCSSPDGVPRTRRMTLYPRAVSEGSKAAPMGPETPLTRMGDKSIAVVADKCNRYGRDWARPLFAGMPGVIIRFKGTG